jgi:hypothetical protein
MTEVSYDELRRKFEEAGWLQLWVRRFAALKWTLFCFEDERDTPMPFTDLLTCLGKTPADLVPVAETFKVAKMTQPGILARTLNKVLSFFGKYARIGKKLMWEPADIEARSAVSWEDFPAIPCNAESFAVLAKVLGKELRIMHQPHGDECWHRHVVTANPDGTFVRIPRLEG